MANKSKPPDSTPAWDLQQAAEVFGLPVDAVFGFRFYDDHVSVVTVDGRKLDSRDLAHGEPVAELAEVEA